MSDTNPAVPPHVEMIRMGTAYWLSSLVYTAANIGLADHLADGAKSAGDLAATTRTNPRALHRFMRTLASFGVLTHNDNDTFALTELGATLKKGAPGAARSTVLTMAGPWARQCFWEFEYSLETGKPAMEKVFGMNVFDYLAQFPELAAQFSESDDASCQPRPT